MLPLLVILVLFYLVALPILVFSLSGRVRTIERMLKQKEPGVRQIKPEPIPSPAKPPRTSIADAKHASLEEKLGGHLFQWIGIAALVIALIFFLKWSFENGLIGPAGRTAIGYLFSCAAIIAGDRLRTRYGVWSLAFTGGGALGAYIVTWMGLHTYALFPSPIAFALYILTTVVVCLLAGYYNAVALAAFGIIGGFVTPLLLGGGGSSLSLLGYILILDLGILALSHIRHWRPLNLLALMGTAAYEILALNDRLFTQGWAWTFIALFFAIYLAIPFTYHLVRGIASRQEDILVLVGNGLLHFCLSMLWINRNTGWLQDYDAIVAVVFAVIFLVFASHVYMVNRKDTPLVLGSLSLGILFASIAVPLQMGGAWVPFAWSVESAFLLWLALRLHDRRLQLFAWLTMAGAYVRYISFPYAGPFLFGPTMTGYSSSPAIDAHTTVIGLFFLWMLYFLAVASNGMKRTDRKEYALLPFALVGAGVLLLSFIMNVSGSGPVHLSGWERLFQIAGLVGGSYIALFQAGKYWTTLTESERKAFAGLGVATQVVTVSYLSYEFMRAIDDGRLFRGSERTWQIKRVGVSLLWAFYGIATLIAGIFRRWQWIRLFGMLLLLVATAKLALVDFVDLGTGARVIGFTVVGALLVGASFLYQRRKDSLKAFFLSRP